MTKRRLLAFVAAFALLFAQVSQAAYACASAVDSHAAMSADCPGHAPATTDAVCALHCDIGASLPASHTPDIAPVASAVLVVPLPDRATSHDAFLASSQRTAMATAPPVAIRFCRLLI